MKANSVKLDGSQRVGLRGLGLALVLSGAAWAWVHRLDEGGEAAAWMRELKPWMLKLHGFAGVGFVLLLGTLIPTHMLRGWNSGRNRINGVFFLVAIAVLTLSGYSLYYLGDEGLRLGFSRLHLWLGLASPLLLFWHIRSGKP